MKKWKIIHAPKSNIFLDSKKVLDILLSNRGIKNKDIRGFLHPRISELSLNSVGIQKNDFLIFEKRIQEANSNNETIAIYGDYDVDGICASAILWETLYSKNKNVAPYIPDRADEGYGLSVKGIDNLLLDRPEVKVIVTVDNGIVAHEPVLYAKSKGIDVIITDHHVAEKKLPEAYCIIHTTKLCGAGIAWLLSRELSFLSKEEVMEKLSLACLATVADLVPLTDSNRWIAKEGLKLLQNTSRPGLKALLASAGVEVGTISTYTIGHIIAPRLNATGRIQNAMNSLRLLCTKNREKALELAALLTSINKERQDMTEESVAHAKLYALESQLTRITIVQSEKYNPGVVGLIASRLVEAFYKPAFAIAVDKEISRGSARSIAGVNVIELLRSVSGLLEETGGHPMAAGFSIRTEKIEEFTKALDEASQRVVLDEVLDRVVRIDMVIPFSLISVKFIDEIGVLEPFGMGNPQPIFASIGVEIVEFRKIGKEQNHLKLKLRQGDKIVDAIAFNMAEKTDVVIGDKIDVAFTLDVNEWDGKITSQLKIKDIRLS